MTRAVLLVIALSTVADATAAEGRIITLSESGEISEARAVKTAIDTLSDAAAMCRKTTSLTPAQCVCRSKAGMSTLRTAYDRAVGDHPDWPQDGITVWWSGTALNFSAIKRELGSCS